MTNYKTLKLTKGQLFNHYAIVPFLLILPIMTTYDLFQIYITKKYTGVRSAEELIWVSWPWLALAIFVYFIQKKRLRFKEFNISVDQEHFKITGLKTADQLGWDIKRISANSITAVRTRNLTGGSWGELITIVRNHDKIFINSICDPDNIISIASWGWNKKNVKTFIANLKLHRT